MTNNNQIILMDCTLTLLQQRPQELKKLGKVKVLKSGIVNERGYTIIERI